MPQGPDPLIGKEIDGCTIVKKIGQGGMGIVYLAEHSKLRQQYVVKILNPALTAAEDTIQRFFREAQSVARLNHPSIVGIQNVGQEGEYYYIRMEYVDGDTVENIVKEKKKLDWKLATNIILETAEALSHAHKKGTIHRDIKPENIMLTKNGEVKVMDFGLAKQVQAATKVSVTGQIVGTPFFMSPEQAGGKTVDARSDIYSLGVSYYYLLTGVKPFNGKNLQEIFLKHFFYTPESPKIYTPDLPENVCEVIRRCLKKKKKERYQSAAMLARDLRAVVEGGELSSPEASDATESSPSTADLGTTNPGTLSASSSDPAIPIAGDLAAAQAELGAGEPGTIVARGGQGNGSATVIAKALAGGEGADDPTAPLSKRGGNRVALTNQAAAASLVFKPGAAPFQGGAPASADATILPEGRPTETGPKLDTKKLAPVPQKWDPGARRRQQRNLIAVGGFFVMLIAVYQVAGTVKFAALEDAYSKALNVHPDSNDIAGWTDLKRDYDDLAASYDRFGMTFKMTPSGAEAPARAEKCRESARVAEESRASAEKLHADEVKHQKDLEEFQKHREEYRKKLSEQLDQLKALVVAKKYDEAARLAGQAYVIADGINERRTEVKCPVELTSDIPAKVYNGATNEELGSLNANVPTVVLVPYKDKAFKLEIRKPKFRSWRTEQIFTTFSRLTVQLSREIKSRFALGKTDEMLRFKLAKFTEKLFVAAPLGIDTQDPATLDVLCQDGSLRSFEIRNGRPRWARHQMVGTYGDRLPAPDVLAGKAIVTTSPDGTIAAHDVPTGNVVYEANVGSPLVAPPRIDPTARYVVAGTLGGEVICLDLKQNGAAAIKWRVNTEASILTQPMIQGNHVLVGSLDDQLRVIDMANGKIVAVYDAREAICAGPIAAGDIIYVGTREGRVHAITISNNGVKAEFTTAPAGSEILQLIASAKGVYYSTKNDIRATDLSGSRMFEPFTPTIDGVPIEVTGFVPMSDAIAITTLSGWVFAIDAKTGRETWKLNLGSPIRVPPVFDGDLHVATADGEIVTIGGD